MGCERVADSLGLSISVQHAIGPRSICAHQVIDRIYRHDSSLLYKVLDIAHSAWPNSPIAMNSVILRGIASFLVMHPDASEERLRHRLKVTPPEEVVIAYKRARMSDARGGARGTMGADASTVRTTIIQWKYERHAIQQVYNFRLQNPLTDPPGPHGR